MTIGKRIRDARLAIGLSQGELAELVGVRYQSVQQWESNSTAPARAKMAKLAGALRTTIPFLEIGMHAAEDAATYAALPAEAREIASAWSVLSDAKKQLYRAAILHDAAMSVVFPEIGGGSVVTNASYHTMIERIRRSRAQIERQMKLKLDH